MANFGEVLEALKAGKCAKWGDINIAIQFVDEHSVNTDKYIYIFDDSKEIRVPYTPCQLALMTDEWEILEC